MWNILKVGKFKELKVNYNIWMGLKTICYACFTSINLKRGPLNMYWLAVLTVIENISLWSLKNYTQGVKLVKLVKFHKFKNSNFGISKTIKIWPYQYKIGFFGSCSIIIPNSVIASSISLHWMHHWFDLTGLPTLNFCHFFLEFNIGSGHQFAY